MRTNRKFCEKEMSSFGGQRVARQILETCISSEIKTTTSCTKLFITPLRSIRKLLGSTGLSSRTLGPFCLYHMGSGKVNSSLYKLSKSSLKQNRQFPIHLMYSQTPFNIIIVIIITTNFLPCRKYACCHFKSGVQLL